MRLWTRVILALSCLTLWLIDDFAGWGHPWVGMLASVIAVGALVVQLSERRNREASEHATMNLQR